MLKRVTELNPKNQKQTNKQIKKKLTHSHPSGTQKMDIKLAVTGSGKIVGVSVAG